MACWLDSTSCAPGADFIVVAGALVGESIACILVILESSWDLGSLSESHWSLSGLNFLEVSSIHQVNRHDRSFFERHLIEFLHDWLVRSVVVGWSWVRLWLVHSLHDSSDVLSFSPGKQAGQEDENEAEARLLSKSMGGLELVFPCDSLSALAKSDDLCEEEDRDSAHGLEGVNELELVSCDEFAPLWTRCWWVGALSSFVVWGLRWWSMDHFFGSMHGVELPVNGAGESDAANGDQCARGALESLLVFFDVCLGLFDLFDLGVSWSWLQNALSGLLRRLGLHENGHVSLHI